MLVLAHEISRNFSTVSFVALELGLVLVTLVACVPALFEPTKLFEQPVDSVTDAHSKLVHLFHHGFGIEPMLLTKVMQYGASHAFCVRDAMLFAVTTLFIDVVLRVHNVYSYVSVDPQFL